MTASAFASCPDFNPPKTPTLEEARASQLCVGTSYAARVAELQRATPEADAKRAADLGRFKLLASATPFSWDGHICTVGYEEDNTVACSLRPAVQSQKVDRDRYHEAFGQIPQRNPGDPGPTTCATVLGRLLADYTGRFNRALVTDPRYTHRDICGPVASTPRLQSGPIAPPTTDGSIQVQPPIELRPPVYVDIAAAARFGDLAAVKREIAAGQDPAARDEFSLTALDWAAIRGFADVQSVLLAEHASDLDVCSALGLAITFKRLQQAGELVTPCSRQGGAVAQNARNAIVNLAASRGYAELLAAFRAAGIDLMAVAPDVRALKSVHDSRDDNLDYVDRVGMGHFEEFERFRASDTGEPEPYSACPLHTASAAGHVGIVRDLLDHGIPADAICHDARKWWSGKRRALLEAINFSRKDVVALLLERGARAGGIDLLPESPAPFRPRSKNITATHLWAQGPPLALALSQRYRSSQTAWPDIRIVDLLLKHGGSPNERGPDGAPAFFSLDWTLEWPPPIVDPFNRLHDKLDVNARKTESPEVIAYPYHPSLQLGLVPASGRTFLMEVLLRPRLAGEKDSYHGVGMGQSTKGVAAGVPLANTAQVFRLIGAGADPRLADEAGQTPLHYAAALDFGTAAALALIEAGADVNARDMAGKTALDHATARKAFKMAAFLKSQGGK